MLKFYRQTDELSEVCFVVEADDEFEPGLAEWLAVFFQERPDQNVSRQSFLADAVGVSTVGPRLQIVTPFSSNAVAVLRDCGFMEVRRVEMFRRTADTLNGLPIFDRMTEQIYSEIPDTFVLGTVEEPTRVIPVLAGGVETLRAVNRQFGLSWDDADIEFVLNLCQSVLCRDPTDVELFCLGIWFSDHTRHRTWHAKIVIDGKEMPHTLMDLAKAAHQKRGTRSNCVLAFCDNALAIRGFRLPLARRENPARMSRYADEICNVLLTLIFETHCYPTAISPREGAGTGIGGSLRDNEAVGRGGSHLMSLACFAMDNLWLPDFVQPWERLTKKMQPANLASPLQIATEAPLGTWDYGNPYGVPVLGGFFYTVGIDVLVDGKLERIGYVKPIMGAGNAGYLRADQAQKLSRKSGQLLVRIGGPAYPIGLGGGPGSSVMTGTSTADLDFNAVQRGDPFNGQVTRRVIQGGAEMGTKNPISYIHDQGAGGVVNVFGELAEATGGKIDYRRIIAGDPTMSALGVVCSEFQESYGLLVEKKEAPVLEEICAREGCPMEILGELTNDGHFVVADLRTGMMPVNLPLRECLTGLPQKTLEDVSPPQTGRKVEFADFTVKEALGLVLRLPAVAAKQFLVNRVDRSVGGLVTRQQGCGPLHLPVADVAVSAISFVSGHGEAVAMGVKPLATVLNPAAGARMSIAEALTNLVWAGITGLDDIAVSGNWMWPAKLNLPGEVAKLYQAAEAADAFMSEVGIEEGGGKDSSSLAAKVDGEVVKSPDTFVCTAIAPVPDVGRTVTPDLKKAGGSVILTMSLNAGKPQRLGGSAFLQCLGEIGEEAPDVDDAHYFRRCFEAVTEMIHGGLLLSGHDCSDGGLIVALLEMCFAGNKGAIFSFTGTADAVTFLFAEEGCLVLECDEENVASVEQIATAHDVAVDCVGRTMTLRHRYASPSIVVRYNGKEILKEKVIDLRANWQEFSHQMDLQVMEPNCVLAERRAQTNWQDTIEPFHTLTFTPQQTERAATKEAIRPAVAVVREKGSNGDSELAAAFREVGFDVFDVTMTDLISGAQPDLKDFRGIAFPGGFSYRDTFGAAVAWSQKVKLHPRLRETFGDFYAREDTFSFGPCNGCQLLARLGWVPFGPDCGAKRQPLFVGNLSEVFESRLVSVLIKESPAIAFRGMAGCVLPVWVAHGEGRLWYPDRKVLDEVRQKKLVPMVYVNPSGSMTGRYPFNPNGSPFGCAGLCDETGRHLAVMPHPERMWQMRQWPWVPEKWRDLAASPWLRMFQNCYDWCCEK